ncbi:MAG: hypothetical protein BWY83_03138 [bacterium ADurb.Bin478]|nr:MAG: hypothetical protein BWY83_03138 [bacterium ADurb.Bin478]
MSLSVRFPAAVVSVLNACSKCGRLKKPLLENFSNMAMGICEPTWPIYMPGSLGVTTAVSDETMVSAVITTMMKKAMTTCTQSTMAFMR